MSAHLAKFKSRMLDVLPVCTNVAGGLPKLPLLTLSTDRNQLLFYGKYSGLLAHWSYQELCALYENYLNEVSVSKFFDAHKIDVTPKVFAEALPYIVISCDAACPICKGTNYIARSANRSAFTYPDGFYVDYACVSRGCDFMVRGNGSHSPKCQCGQCPWSMPKERAEKKIPLPCRAAPNELQEYLLAVIDAYVPESKSRIIHQYANGKIKIEQVEDLTGIRRKLS